MMAPLPTVWLTVELFPALSVIVFVVVWKETESVPLVLGINPPSVNTLPLKIPMTGVFATRPAQVAVPMAAVLPDAIVPESIIVPLQRKCARVVLAVVAL